jgi:mannose-6-phosphate isomerase
MTFLSKAYILTNKIQHYEWGERGGYAFIAKLLDMRGVGENTPLAEMWMGTHPLGTSELNYGGKPALLSDLVQRYPVEILGRRVASAFVNQFPFLLKILSANEPLSIQLHPSKEQAAALRQKDPVHYPDSNHKPELAIALEHLRALAGLRDARQVAALMDEYPALRDFVEFETFSDQPKHRQPKLAFQSLLSNSTLHSGEMALVIDQVAVSIHKKSRIGYREKLFLEMSVKYPGDVGLLAIFFLKLHSLNKGQAMFIPAGVPHAYLKGNIVECMASSDNVIRAGLTPKFNDIPALLEVVTDRPVVLFSPDAPSYVYPTPVSEFRVSKLALEAGQKINETDDSVRVLLILSGRIKLAWADGAPYAETGTAFASLEAGRGQAVLVPASLVQIEIECLETCEIFKADVP